MPEARRPWQLSCRPFTPPEGRPVGASKRVWVIIVTYNGAPWIADCVRSVSCSLVEQVVVVDNASTDGTVAIIRSLELPVKLVTLTRNIGFGRANNIGIAEAIAAGAAHVLLLNQDALIDELNLSRLCRAMEASPDFGILSPFWLTYDGSATDPLGRLLTTGAFWDDVLFDRLATIYETGMVPAACVLIRAAVFDSVGGFDPLFFMYSEDDDLCHRAATAGWRIGFVPRAAVRHWHTQIRSGFPGRLEIERQYSVAVFRLKASPRPLLMRYLGLIRFWLPGLPPEYRPRIRLVLIRLRVLVRCLVKAGAILRSRRLMPRTLAEERDPLLISPQVEDAPDQGRLRAR